MVILGSDEKERRGDDGWIRLWYKMAWSSLVTSSLISANSQRKDSILSASSGRPRGVVLSDCTCKAFAFIHFTATNYTVHFFVAGSWFSPPHHAQSGLVRLDSSVLRSTGSNRWLLHRVLLIRSGAVRLGLLIIHRQVVIQL